MTAALTAFPSAAAAQAPPDSSFQKVVIDATPGEPMDLVVLPVGKVLHTELLGLVDERALDPPRGRSGCTTPTSGSRRWRPSSTSTSTTRRACKSIAIDPNFEENTDEGAGNLPPLTGSDEVVLEPTD